MMRVAASDRDRRVRRLAAYRPDPELLKLPNAMLVEMLLDLKLRISRERADAGGRAVRREDEFRRPANTEGRNDQHQGNKAKVVASIEATVKDLSRATGWIEVSDVASRMKEHRRSARSIWRCPEYMAPILRANGQEVPVKVVDPERARIEGLLKVEVIEEIRVAKLELRRAKVEFEEKGGDDGGDEVDLDDLRALADAERAKVGRK